MLYLYADGVVTSDKIVVIRDGAVYAGGRWGAGGGGECSGGEM